MATCCVLVAGCGGGDGSTTQDTGLAGSGGEAGAPALTCPDGDVAAVARLRSGLPTYDYDPAVDLADLVARSDVVVGGEIESMVRVVETDDAHTVISATNVEVLAGEGVVDTFSTASWWALRDQPDPLGEPVPVDGVRFVAFLDAGPWPGGYAVDVQGLYVGCDREVPPKAVIEGLPPDAANLSLNELSQEIAGTGQPQQLAFDDPALAGLCEDVSSSLFAEGESSPSPSVEAAVERFVLEHQILEGLVVEDGRIVHRGEQVGGSRVVARAGDTFAVDSAEWCYPDG